MRKTLIVLSAVLLTAYFSAPVMAEDPADGSESGVAVASVGDTSPVIAAKGKRRVRRAPKPSLEDTVRKIVDETMSKRPMEWSYMAKRMRPPKSAKWRARWDNLGGQGWELVGQNENVYIFKRPASMASAEPMPMKKERKAKKEKAPKVKKEKAPKEKKVK